MVQLAPLNMTDDITNFRTENSALGSIKKVVPPTAVPSQKQRHKGPDYLRGQQSQSGKYTSLGENSPEKSPLTTSDFMQLP